MRPSKFKPEMCEQAKKLCAQGFTDKELADFFEVSERTIYNWAADYPEFLQSLKLGKEASDHRVERSLFHRATGYSHQAVKIFCDPKTGSKEIIEFVEHYPPDTTACIFWLKNRKPAEWRDKIDVEHKDVNDRKWQEIAEHLSAQFNVPIEQVRRDLAAQKPELASTLLQ